MTTPANGARIWCLSSIEALRLASILAVSNCDCAWRNCALSTPTRACALVRSASVAKFFCDRVWTRVMIRGRVLQIGGDRGDRSIGRLGARAGQLIVPFGKHAIEPR